MRVPYVGASSRRPSERLGSVLQASQQASESRPRLESLVQASGGVQDLRAFFRRYHIWDAWRMLSDLGRAPDAWRTLSNLGRAADACWDGCLDACWDVWRTLSPKQNTAIQKTSNGRLDQV